jgi:hypothetical protein
MLRLVTMRLGSLALLGIVLLTLGCAEQLQLLDRGPVGGVSPCSFWPPPLSSKIWVVEPWQSLHPESLSTVARQLEVSLHEGGYSQQRWYPIGVGQRHGFAVTTRLEQLDRDREPSPSARWSSLYADPAELRWLTLARAPTLPHPGRYRVLLLAYTDLAVGRTSTAPVWNEETIMDWPEAPRASSARDITGTTLAPNDYRFAIYEYEYAWDNADGRGKLAPASEKSPPAISFEAAGFPTRPVQKF